LWGRAGVVGEDLAPPESMVTPDSTLRTQKRVD
jgi:hypothetical protein